eukprot:TRINITY_DN11800_c0_g1_i3.p1 TRINITY_DN11800_c0_g1~~TRINITY_DN11800_c0_g1_i3.p1  ORF type:complete len:555 (+),score=148.23 TRINITY_DN11800_c0_g1_i3:151-1815(+)
MMPVSEAKAKLISDDVASRPSASILAQVNGGASRASIPPVQPVPQVAKKSVVASRQTVQKKRSSAGGFKKLKEQFARCAAKVGTPQSSKLTLDDCMYFMQQAVPTAAPKPEEVEEMLRLLEKLAWPVSTCKTADVQKGLDLNAFIILMGEPPDEVMPLRDAFSIEEEANAAAELLAKRRGNVLLLDVVPAMIVIANALVIGISSDVLVDHVLWQVVEIFFTTAFTIEAVYKSHLFGCRTYLCGADCFWNWFDLFCILTAYIDLSVAYIIVPIMGSEEPEIGILMLLKMLRLARLSRLIRLLRFKFFAELKMMILGVFSGIRVLFWAIVLLFSIVYLLGVVMRKTIGPAREEFATVFAAMFSVFRCFTDGCATYSGTPMQEMLRMEYGAGFMVAYILVFLLITFGLFNLIMAIFIDNVVSAQGEKRRRELGEATDKTRQRMQDVIQKLAGVDPETDAAAMSDLQITREIFQAWMEEQDMLALLEEAGIESSSKYEMFDVLDVDMGGSLGFDEMIDGMMSLRGDVTKTDIVAIRMKVRYATKMVEDLHATFVGEEE